MFRIIIYVIIESKNNALGFGYSIDDILRLELRLSILSWSQ
jgi:hypothetical protein